MKNTHLLLLIFILCINNTIFSQNNDFLKEVSFDFTYGVPIIKVSIKGEKYNFLFDTGMPTTISESLNKKLKLNSSRNTIGSDINGNRNNESYSVLKNIKIADIDFNNTEVLIANLKSSYELKCLQLDGVVGNNLIKDAIWEIDYETKKIRFTNNIQYLEISKDFIKIDFLTKKDYYTPKIDLEINGITQKNIKFDTGSNDGINLPLKVYSYKMHKKSIKYYGSSNVALYGHAKKNKAVISKIDSVEIGTLKIKDQLIVFNRKTPLIGNKFLSNFIVVIDYSKNTIYLSLNKNTNNILVENFGFFTNIINNKMIVTQIYKNTFVSKKLRIGDEILSINNIPISTILKDINSCITIRNIFTVNTINEFEIKHKNKVIKLQIKKMTLIE